MRRACRVLRHFCLVSPAAPRSFDGLCSTASAAHCAQRAACRKAWRASVVVPAQYACVLAAGMQLTQALLVEPAPAACLAKPAAPADAGPGLPDVRRPDAPAVSDQSVRPAVCAGC